MFKCFNKNKESNSNNDKKTIVIEADTFYYEKFEMLDNRIKALEAFYREQNIVNDKFNLLFLAQERKTDEMINIGLRDIQNKVDYLEAIQKTIGSKQEKIEKIIEKEIAKVIKTKGKEIDKALAKLAKKLEKDKTKDKA